MGKSLLACHPATALGERSTRASRCRLPRPVLRGSILGATGRCNMGAVWVDILAVGFFIIEGTVYAFTLEHSAYGQDSLSARMHVYREVWIRRMLERET